MKKNLKLTIPYIISFFLGLAIFSSASPLGFQAVIAETTEALAVYPTWYFPGSISGSDMGSAVSGVGDINGDGKADVLVGAQKDEISIDREGMAYAFFGNGGILSNIPDWVVSGEQQGSMFGCAISGLGDVNNDGVDDVAISACDYNLLDEFGVVVKSKVGATFVYFGSINSLPLKKVPDWKILGQEADDHLGTAISSAGDLNKDGYNDLIIGVPYHDGESVNNNGKVMIFLGSETGFSDAPDWTAFGELNTSLFGKSVANAGDVNGDGRNDIIIGSPRPTGIGSVQVFYNSAGGLAPTPSVSITNGNNETWFGDAVAGVGDVNGDGYDDVLVGAPYAKVLINDIYQAAGCVYLYRGSASGLVTTPIWTRCADQIGGKFGASVAAAGDMNDDGHKDVLVGMPYFSLSNEKQGAVYLYFGGDYGVRTDYYDFTYGNKAETEFGASISSAGDLNLDGRLDVLVGAPEYKSNNIRVGRSMAYYAGLTGIPDEESYPVYLPIILDDN